MTRKGQNPSFSLELMLSADGCTIGPFFGGGKRVAVRRCAEVYHAIAWGHLILPGGRLTSFCVWDCVCVLMRVLPGSRRNALLAFRAPVPRPAQKGEERLELDLSEQKCIQ